MAGRFEESTKKPVKKKKVKESPQQKKKEEEELRRFGPFGNKWYESLVGNVEEFMGDKHSVRPP
ncbi:hypothetical protein Hanom_Chr06g00549841 [Helianthus anomalus]